MLAESVSIDGGTLLLLLVLFLLFVGIAVSVVVFGFVLAPRAGRGSRRALGWWVAIIAIEGLYCLGALSTLLSGRFSLWVFVAPILVASQVSTFLRARRDRDL